MVAAGRRKMRSGADDGDSSELSLHKRDYYISERRRAREARRNSNPDFDTSLREQATTATTTAATNHRRYDDAINDKRSVLNQFLSTERRLGSCKTFYYSLSMEPFPVRRERIIMLTEAYAVFGALFLEGTWFVWAYGSTREFENPILERIFDVSSTIALIANLFLTMFGGFHWLLAILYSGTHPNWVYGAADSLIQLHYFLIVILFSTTVSVGIAAYNYLKENQIEAITMLVIIGFLVLDGMRRISFMIADQIPLEYFHFPFWFRNFVLPFPNFTHQKEILENAKSRASLLMKHSEREKTEKPISSDIGSNIGLELLLERSSDNIGFPNLDIIPFVVKLEEELYGDVDSIKELTVDELASFMPLRLAKSVHLQLSNEFADH